MPKLRLCMFILMSLPLLAGCATGGGNHVQNAVYDTHRRVANLEQNLQGSIEQLNETAAGLLARVDANEQSLRAVAGGLEENRARMNRLEQKLDSLIRTYDRQQQLSPSSSPMGQSEVEISDQDFVVEDTVDGGRR